MESLDLVGDNIIKKSFQTKKQQTYTAVKEIRSLFRLKKKGIKDIVLNNINNFFEFETEEENYYKPVTKNNFWSNGYIEYKSNGDKNKILSVAEYHSKIVP